MDLIGKKKFDFIKNRKKAFLISAVVILISIISIVFQGFNFGIDFAGGTIFQINLIILFLLLRYAINLVNLI